MSSAEGNMAKVQAKNAKGEWVTIISSFDPQKNPVLITDLLTFGQIEYLKGQLLRKASKFQKAKQPVPKGILDDLQNLMDRTIRVKHREPSEIRETPDGGRYAVY
jgi:hypothetical protein